MDACNYLIILLFYVVLLYYSVCCWYLPRNAFYCWTLRNSDNDSGIIQGNLNLLKIDNKKFLLKTVGNSRNGDKSMKLSLNK